MNPGSKEHLFSLRFPSINFAKLTQSNHDNSDIPIDHYCDTVTFTIYMYHRERSDWKCLRVTDKTFQYEFEQILSQHFPLTYDAYLAAFKPTTFTGKNMCSLR